ncbi:polyphosphate polymerase domain-containing protein [Lachnospiraceae bacterium 42-17]|jgi:SPX domain protein involved in polyphosphate accumulation|nr:polyphosphate polymerase domain-containing protein [Dorea sp.]
MKFRHEWKHEINASDFITITQRLSAVARPDAHGNEGNYIIRSLYFDNSSDKALREKIDGINRREKFRLRYYNNDISYIHLEKKSKYNGLSSKELVQVSNTDVEKLLNGKYQWLADPKTPLTNELYSKMMSQGLKPKTIVEYERKAYIYKPGNVRITLDYHIRTGMLSTDFLNKECILIPIRNPNVIMEVKWDGFLPEIIRDVVQLKGRFSSAFSKYAACRVYG